MVFEVYLKKDVGNDISNILNMGIKKFTVPSISVVDGFLEKGSYKIPISHVLFIKEVQ